MNTVISVCIPAYNRPEVLVSLLDSILIQNYADFEIVICEDKSPAREQIRDIVSTYSQKRPGLFRYFENEHNLGYDGNIRNLIEKASGDYCLFMGNDDLMYPGALATVASTIARYENVGVLLRTYASFNESPENIDQVFRYFQSEIFFPAGSETITTFYRRSVVISGMVIQRKEALKYSTPQFDGTLLYQLYLVANVLTRMNGVFVPQILALYRNGGIPDFGNSEKEKGKFTPKIQTPESSLHFMQGMLEIARWTESARGVRIYRPILKDIGNYSYPILAIQAKQPVSVFLKYAYRLAVMGFWKNKLFYLYLLSLLFLGPARVDRIIQYIKRRVGHTPVLGKVYRGGA
ncbi:MAG: glycosyltransferase family 2 protein [Gammaproteobacteria bacterium]|nr:glycosyltransferase family 2 protein [Gammaproteobacteria bacterium]